MVLLVAATAGARGAESATTTSTAVPITTFGLAADQIIGQDVRSTTGQKLGEVSDLVVDRNGRILYALVSSGGLLGVGNIVRAVPFDTFTSRTTAPDKALAVDLHNADWNKAPIVRMDRIAALGPDEQGREVYRYFGSDWPSKSDVGRDARNLMLVSKIDGQAVVNDGQRVGEIEDVRIQGDHAIAVLQPAPGYGVAGRHYAVGIDQLSWASPTAPAADTTLTQAELQQATPLPATGFAANSGKPYLLDETALSGRRLAPITDQGAAPVPVAAIPHKTTAAEVRQTLAEDPTLAGAMRNVHVADHGDELVITGKVSSQDLKQRIGAKAARAANGLAVSNEIIVGQSAAE